MKFPIKWLNEYVKINDVPIEELKDKLLNIGFEVEDVIYRGEGIENVVTGKITQITAHPNADKLKVCSVDCGKRGIFTIVTGADNVREGNVVPVALDGAKLPGGKVINSSPMRGVMSCGMMCSGKELNIDDSVAEGAEVYGILILDKKTPLGEDIVKVLGMDNYILDISVTANRPDCQSVYGMAREISAALNRKLKPLDLDYQTVKNHSALPSVTVENEEDCPLYTGCLIENVKVKSAPMWMKERLSMCGIRSINALVDITNYVLLEVGQPLHAFDMSLITGGIKVRRAAEGEKITALNGEEYSLDDKMLVIADDNGAAAIAGVMGGKNSGINDATNKVFLEVARFAKGRVRYASRNLGLRSDSSARYEKGVDYNCVYTGRARALSLIYSLGLGEIAEQSVSVGSGKFEKTIKTSFTAIDGILGIHVDKRVICRILDNLGFETSAQKDKLSVKVPLYREDIDNFTDICEEVIRFYGYDKLKESYLKTAEVTVGGYTERQRRIADVKNILCANGLFETMNFSFVSKKNCLDLGIDPENVIKIKNPLGEDFAYMRNSLVPSMLATAKTNFSRSNKEFRIYEISVVFCAKKLPLQELPDENLSLCAVFSDCDFYDVKGVAEKVVGYFADGYSLRSSDCGYLHPGISGEFVLSGNVVCRFGKLHPTTALKLDIKHDLYVLECDLETLLKIPPRVKKYSALPKLPEIERDLAVTVSENMPVGELMDAIRTSDKNITSVSLFDVYRGEQIESGFKSVAMSFRIRQEDRSLTDEEINGIMNCAINALEKIGAKLR